jgi:dTMP kinase
MIKGKLITLEGGEGSGKSTQAGLIYSYLKINGVDSTIFREPGGTKISEQIREVLLNTENIKMNKITELLLFMAARRQIVSELIEPTLNSGTWVICDRYIDSSVVYQGIARGIGVNIVTYLNNLVIGGAIPDLTLYLDVDVDVGLSRVYSRGKMNRIDYEDTEFHYKVREGYQSIYGCHPERIVKIDANKSIEDIIHEIETYISILL